MFRPEEQWVITLTRYTAVDGSVILLGDWHEKDRGNEGSSMFELKPQQPKFGLLPTCSQTPNELFVLRRGQSSFEDRHHAGVISCQYGFAIDPQTGKHSDTADSVVARFQLAVVPQVARDATTGVILGYAG